MLSLSFLSTFFLTSTAGLFSADTGRGLRPLPGLSRGVIRSAVLASGVRLEYLEQGNPDGTPLVLLHGYSDSRHSWDPVLPLLPNTVRVFALTQRGHGDSDKPALGYGPGDFSADVAQFMDAVGISRAVIVGHSMGGTVAKRFALEYPARTMGVVLIGAMASWAGNDGLEEFWNNEIAKLGDPVSTRFILDFQQSTLARPISQDYLDLVVAESGKLPLRVWRDIFLGFLAQDSLSASRTITAPSLLLWGSKDGFTTLSDQHRLQEIMPRSRLLTYYGTGHAVHWEEPARVANDLIGFANLAGRLGKD